MGDGADISARGYARAERGFVGGSRQYIELQNFNLNRLECHLLFFAGQFVGGDSSNFLGGKWRRHLLDDAVELGGSGANVVEVEVDVLERRGRLSVGVIGVGGKAEANHTFVSLLRVVVELRQTGQVADYDGQNSGGGGVEGTEMSDGTLSKNSAHTIDYIVGGEACRFIDDYDAIHGDL